MNFLLNSPKKKDFKNSFPLARPLKAVTVVAVTKPILPSPFIKLAVPDKINASNSLPYFVTYFMFLCSSSR